jgi:polyisoprenoid-binding protein YceI
MVKWLALLILVLVRTASAAPRSYSADPQASQVRIHVGKAGLVSFAGHVHSVVAPLKSGTVVADFEDPGQSRVELAFETASLTVESEGEPAGDPPKVQEAMRGPKVLDAAHFPVVSFRSTRVTVRQATGHTYELEVAGELSLHGVTRTLVVPVRVETSESSLLATGKFQLSQRDFSIHTVGVGSLVKTKNELDIELKVSARPAP